MHRTKLLIPLLSATTLAVTLGATVAPNAAADTASASASASAATTYAVSGSVRVRWLALGGAAGRLGQPVSGEISTNGGVVQKFQGGNIYYRSDTGAHAVWSAVYAKWRQYGFESGRLGFPTTDEISTNGGVVQKFQGGNIYYKSGLGAHPVWSGIYSLWRQAGFESGRYGFPTSDEYKNSDGRTRQDFQHGSLYWGTSTTASSQPTGVWARLAQCESGGIATLNTGNGYYGLYQFSLSTWRAMGGTGLPSEASAAEQTRLAQKLQAQAGWGQWPGCAAKLGLL